MPALSIAVRSLLRVPAFTITAVLILTLGIGANTAVTPTDPATYACPHAGR